MTSSLQTDGPILADVENDMQTSELEFRLSLSRIKAVCRIFTTAALSIVDIVAADLEQ